MVDGKAPVYRAPPPESPDITPSTLRAAACSAFGRLRTARRPVEAVDHPDDEADDQRGVDSRVDDEQGHELAVLLPPGLVPPFPAVTARQRFADVRQVRPRIG